MCAITIEFFVYVNPCCFTHSCPVFFILKLPLAALHNQQEDANDSLGTTLVQPPSLKRKYSNASERKKGGVSKGRNKAKPKGKTGQKESGGTKIDENSRTTGYQLFDADYSTVPTEPSSSQRRSKRLIRGKKGRSRAAAAAGIDNGLPLSTTTVDGGSAVENFVYSQCKGDSFLLKVVDRHTVFPPHPFAAH